MLILQKLIKLLDDTHFQHFREHVKNINVRSYYPLALIDVLDRDPFVEQTTDDLCKAIYDDNEESTKKKFFQLVSYTFKLSSFLVKNYPDYLAHNLATLQRLFNEGKREQANLLADMLLDVSQKIENFSFEIKIAQILAHQQLLLENQSKAVSYFDRISELQEIEKILNDIKQYVYTNYTPKGKAPKKEIEEHLEYLKTFENNNTFAVKTYCQYYQCLFLHYYRDERFYDETTFEKLLQLEKGFKQFNYVYFPYLDDIEYKVNFLKLRYGINKLDWEGLLKDGDELFNSSKNLLYWNSFVNFPELLSIGVQTNFYAGANMRGYRRDAKRQVPEEIQIKIAQLKERCKSVLENDLLEEKFVIRYINLNTVYAFLLLCGDEKEIKESIQLMENILMVYQQVPFHAFSDAIFSILIMAHFCLEDYEKVDENFKRYKKILKNKVVNPENNWSIHGLYYASKWLQTKRSQYAIKLNTVMQQITEANFQNSSNLFTDIKTYYNIPDVD